MAINIFESLKRAKNNSILFNIKLLNDKKIQVDKKILKLLNPWLKSKEWKKESVEAYRLYNSGDFLDIGSCFGVYFFFLAPKAKKNKFVGVEPNIKNQEGFLHTVSYLSKIFPHINFIKIPFPISNSNFVSYDDTKFGHIKYIKKYNNKIFSIKGDELVNFLDLKPTLIKIDVEGAEKDVVFSLDKTLDKFRPNLILEKHPGYLKNEEIQKIDKFLIKRKYKKKKTIYADSLAICEVWKYFKNV